MPPARPSFQATFSLQTLTISSPFLAPETPLLRVFFFLNFAFSSPFFQILAKFQLLRHKFFAKFCSKDPSFKPKKSVPEILLLKIWAAHSYQKDYLSTTLSCHISRSIHFYDEQIICLSTFYLLCSTIVFISHPVCTFIVSSCTCYDQGIVMIKHKHTLQMTLLMYLLLLKTLDLLSRVHTCQKWKSTFPSCSFHEIYRVEAFGLSVNNYTFESTIYVSMWNLGQFLENWYFVNNCLIKVWI